MLRLSQEDAAKEVEAHLGKQGYYHSATYDTSLLFSDDTNEVEDVYHHFYLFNRPILWINPVKLAWDTAEHNDENISARAVIPCKSPEDFDGILIMNRLASLLCYVTWGSPVSPISWSGTGFPAAMMISDLAMRPYTVVRHDALDALIAEADPDNICNKKWIGIAQYRQAIISHSPYYTFLSYWKIIELYFDDNSSEMSRYLDKILKNMDLVKDLHDSTKTPSARLYSTRNRCAHFALTQRRGNEVQDPDDPISYSIAQKDSKPLKKIVEDLLKNGTWQD